MKIADQIQDIKFQIEKTKRELKYQEGYYNGLNYGLDLLNELYALEEDESMKGGGRV